MYDRKYLVRCLALLGIMMGAMYVSKGSGILLVIPFIIGALTKGKAEDLFFYLLLLISMTMGNEILMPKGSIFAVAERSILVVLAIIMALRLSGKRNSPLVTPALSILPYVVFMAVSSLSGWCPVISLLKLFLFVMIFFSYYGVANDVATSRFINSQKIRAAVLSVAIFFIIGSVALIPFPAIGMMKAYAFEVTREYSSLFMGMTQHSQSLGPIAASFGVVVLSDFLFSVRKMDKLYVVLLVCVPVLVWHSHSRTAMGALLVGCATSLRLFYKLRGVSRRWKGRVYSSAVLIVLLGVGLFMAVGGVRIGAKNFALKFHEVENSDQRISLKDITSTREGLMEVAMENFRKSPVVGNGFQVSEDMQSYSLNKDGLMVLSAPIEKGVWITAILEEGGVIGMILFVFFAISFYALLVQRKAYTAATAFVVLLTSNLGEFTLFSMSYTGGMLWALVFAGIAIDAARDREFGQNVLFWC